MIGKLYGGLGMDAFIHGGVSLLSFIFILTLKHHESDDQALATLATVLVVGSLLQLIYHLGLGLRAFCGKDEELLAGSILRNLLTAICLIASIALWGLRIKQTNEGVDWRIAATVSIFVIMRIFDTAMNIEYKKWEFSKLFKHSCKDDETAVIGGGEKKVLFTPRLIIVHILLICCIILSCINLSQDAGYIKPVENEASTIDLIAALCGQGLHFLLYPFAFMLNACGVADSCLAREDKCGDRKELISVNRMPLVRSVVAMLILGCLSYAYGELLPSAKTQLLLANLGIYLAADQIGFDVI